MAEDGKNSQFRTKNRSEVIGFVDGEPVITENSISFFIKTEERINGKVFPTRHPVTVRRGMKIFEVIRHIKKGDYVAIEGPIANDEQRCIIPVEYFNFSYSMVFLISKATGNSGGEK